MRFPTRDVIGAFLFAVAFGLILGAMFSHYGKKEVGREPPAQSSLDDILPWITIYSTTYSP